MTSILKQLGGELNVTENKQSGYFGKLGGSFLSILEGRRYTKKEKIETSQATHANLINDMKNIFNKIICEIRQITKKKIVIIVDDLEKVISLKTIESLFVDNYHFVNRLEANFIFTIPLSLRYSNKFEGLRRTYDKEYTLPLFEVRRVTGEINLLEVEKMTAIIRKRVNSEIIDKKSIYYAVVYSGGVVSDLLRLVSTAIIKAVTYNQEISPKIITESFMEERIDTRRPMNKDDKDILEEIQKTKLPITDKELWIQLLYSLRVLEYRNTIDGELRYEIHPFASSDITELQKVLNQL